MSGSGVLRPRRHQVGANSPGQEPSPAGARIDSHPDRGSIGGDPRGARVDGVARGTPPGNRSGLGPPSNSASRSSIAPLLGDEVQHVGSPPLDRVLLDDREEHLQVVGRRQDRVGTSPGQPNTGPPADAPGGASDPPPNSTRHGIQVMAAECSRGRPRSPAYQAPSTSDKPQARGLLSLRRQSCCSLRVIRLPGARLRTGTGRLPLENLAPAKLPGVRQVVAEEDSGFCGMRPQPPCGLPSGGPDTRRGRGTPTSRSPGEGEAASQPPLGPQALLAHGLYRPNSRPLS